MSTAARTRSRESSVYLGIAAARLPPSLRRAGAVRAERHADHARSAREPAALPATVGASPAITGAAIPCAALMRPALLLATLRKRLPEGIQELGATAPTLGGPALGGAAIAGTSVAAASLGLAGAHRMLCRGGAVRALLGRLGKEVHATQPPRIVRSLTCATA